ncbi:MAG: hypothetical protein MZW92_53695 [Comamonadaceae bacterium]|nr:hypothetical protein [Comamonadaceae bacterium]
MFAAKRHLDDNVLIRRYLADRGLAALDAGDEGPLRHLAHCPACDARYEALRAGFEEPRETPPSRTPTRSAPPTAWNVSAIASSGASTPCTPARGSCPSPPPPDTATRRRSHGCSADGWPPPRWPDSSWAWAPGAWSSAARPRPPRPRTHASRRRRARRPPVRQAPTMRALHVEPAVNDEEFLSEIELATAAPRTRGTAGDLRLHPRGVARRGAHGREGLIRAHGRRRHASHRSEVAGRLAGGASGHPGH